MGTPFKMKGSPMARNFGIGSPLHETAWEKIKTAAKKGASNVKESLSKTYDKASQIGMGLKAVSKVKTPNTTYHRGETALPGERSVKAFVKGYKAEKKSDEKTANLKNRPKAPKVKPPTMEQNIKNVQGMKKRQKTVNKINKANPGLNLKY